VAHADVAVAFPRRRTDGLAMKWKHIEDIDKPGDVYLSRLMIVRTRWFGAAPIGHVASMTIHGRLSPLFCAAVT
jgi:hypothetical protein